MLREERDKVYASWLIAGLTIFLTILLYLAIPVFGEWYCRATDPNGSCFSALGIMAAFFCIPPLWLAVIVASLIGALASLVAVSKGGDKKLLIPLGAIIAVGFVIWDPLDTFPSLQVNNLILLALPVSALMLVFPIWWFLAGRKRQV